MENYIFVDKDFKVVEESGFLDEEAAERRAEMLSRRHMKQIVCYKYVVSCNTVPVSSNSVRDIFS